MVILNCYIGVVMWLYYLLFGFGMFDYFSFVVMFFNGDVIVGDDFNDCVIVIDFWMKKIVW